jgi:hypothetical protein
VTIEVAVMSRAYYLVVVFESRTSVTICVDCVSDNCETPLGSNPLRLPADSFVLRAKAKGYGVNGRGHIARPDRGRTKVSSGSADSRRQLCVRTVFRLEKQIAARTPKQRVRGKTTSLPRYVSC